MAGQAVGILVQRQRDITVLAAWHPAAGIALHHRRKAATVLEQDNLLLIAKGLTNSCQQLWRERTRHHLSPPQIFHIDHLYLWQFNTLIACPKCHKSVFSYLRIIISFHRGCCGAKKNIGPQHHRHTSCMIARGRILLLERCLMFFIDDDQS